MKKKINEALIIAMKEKNSLKRNILRYINSEIKRLEKDSNKELDDNAIINIIKKEIKSMEDNISIALNNNHFINYYDEDVKIQLLNSFLPKQLTDDELNSAINELFITNNYSNISIAMKDIIPKLSSVADKKLISNLIKSKF